MRTATLLSLRTSLLVALLCGLGAGCLVTTDDDDATTDDDDATTDDDDATTDDDDATTDDDDATTDDDDATADDDDATADDDDSASGAPTLPLVLTDWYFLTGYFAEWSPGDLWTTVLESETPGTCAARAGLARGDCMRVTYNRDPDGDGVGPNFSGYFWQYPANNWGQDDDGDGQPSRGWPRWPTCARTTSGGAWSCAPSRRGARPPSPSGRSTATTGSWPPPKRRSTAWSSPTTTP
jgi:hypothetical protein